jgi:hypothetical protein
MEDAIMMLRGGQAMASERVGQNKHLLEAVDEYVAGCYSGKGLVSTAHAVRSLRGLFPAEEITDAFIIEMIRTRAKILGLGITTKPHHRNNTHNGLAGDTEKGRGQARSSVTDDAER